MKITKIKETPKDITLAFMEVVVMPNGEIFFFGRRVGMLKRVKEHVWLQEEERIKK